MENKNKIPDSLIVHCRTKEIAREVLKRFHDLGCIWVDGSSCFEGENYWKIYAYDTCFIYFGGRINYTSRRNLMEYRIMFGEDFLNKYPVTNNILKPSKLNRIKLKFTL